jgi:hypothetical protein
MLPSNLYLSYSDVPGNAATGGHSPEEGGGVFYVYVLEASTVSRAAGQSGHVTPFHKYIKHAGNRLIRVSQPPYSIHLHLGKGDTEGEYPE